MTSDMFRGNRWKEVYRGMQTKDAYILGWKNKPNSRPIYRKYLRDTKKFSTSQKVTAAEKKMIDEAFRDADECFVENVKELYPNAKKAKAHIKSYGRYLDQVRAETFIGFASKGVRKRSPSSTVKTNA